MRCLFVSVFSEKRPLLFSSNTSNGGPPFSIFQPSWRGPLLHFHRFLVFETEELSPHLCNSLLTTARLHITPTLKRFYSFHATTTCTFTIKVVILAFKKTGRCPLVGFCSRCSTQLLLLLFFSSINIVVCVVVKTLSGVLLLDFPIAAPTWEDHLKTCCCSCCCYCFCFCNY